MLMTPSIKCLLAKLAAKKKSLILFPGYSRCKKKPDSQPSLAKRRYESGFA
jgi:hypothetical protein